MEYPEKIAKNVQRFKKHADTLRYLESLLLSKNLKLVALTLFLICSLILTTSPNRIFSQPYPWLRKGTYFIYKVYGCTPKSFYLLKWEIIKVKDNIAYIKITLLNYSKSCVVKVNVLTREVFMNDERIGVTYMFFERYPRKSKVDFLYESTGKLVWYTKHVAKFIPSEKGNITKIKVEISGLNPPHYTNTPQGTQRIYIVYSLFFTLLYDYDTGILVQGDLCHTKEAFFKAIERIGVYLFSYYSNYVLYDTNADLGPIKLSAQITAFIVRNLPLIIFMASLAAVFIILYRRKGRSRNHSKS